jgi:glutamate N-acetyltransferase/amino-acid N-acetyltransferase
MRTWTAPTFPPSPLALTDVAGLRAAGVSAGIKPSGRPDVALLVADEPVPAAAVFTQNAFAAAPVRLCREHLARSGGRVRAVVVNAGNANACTGARGEEHALQMARAVAGRLRCPEQEVLVASTGVIGVPLPIERVISGIDAACDALSTSADADRRFLAAIQTTDAFPKEASDESGGAKVAGVAKGAGMIMPDMATMLAFIATDLVATPEQLRSQVGAIAASSFNAVYVDGHASTNDTFLLLATGRTAASSSWEELPWLDGATRVARRLAWLIARDGEGATKVTTIVVRGAASPAAARAIAREVASSALVRTALFGNDPNWGRFVSQVGNSRHVVAPSALRCFVQGSAVFERGEPARFDRASLSAAMATEDVEIRIELADGSDGTDLLVSDLGYRYVEVNAEYTT